MAPLDLLGLVAHHHDRPGEREARGGVEDMAEQRAPVDLVEDLGQVGFHPRALAGGEDEADPAAFGGSGHGILRGGACPGAGWRAARIVPTSPDIFVAPAVIVTRAARAGHREHDVVDEPGLAHEAGAREHQSTPQRIDGTEALGVEDLGVLHPAGPAAQAPPHGRSHLARTREPPRTHLRRRLRTARGGCWAPRPAPRP